jgi:hypothetical protein
VHVAHLHVVDFSVLLTQSAAVVPTGHGGESVLIEGFGRSVEVCVLWFLLLRAVDRRSGGLVLCILRELRDGRRCLGVALMAAMVVVAAGGAAGETG